MRPLWAFILGLLVAGTIGYMFWYDATNLSMDEVLEMQ